ncbi:MAG TPA: hypothetical protein VKK81_03720 [Candidatus Binatia bacterium]|nr:hypothetical protein [Candidatus Binatia bacterium]
MRRGSCASLVEVVAIGEDGFPSPVVVDVIEFACSHNTGLSMVQGFQSIAVLLVEIAELFLPGVDDVRRGEGHGLVHSVFGVDAVAREGEPVPTSAEVKVGGREVGEIGSEFVDCGFNFFYFG